MAEMNRVLGDEPTVEVIGEEVATTPTEPVADSLDQAINAYLITKREDASYSEALQTLSSNGVQSLIEQVSYTPEMQEERRQQRVTDFQEKFSDVYNYPDFAYDHLIAAADPDVDINDFRYSVNTQIGLQIADGLKNIEGEGVVDAVLDFASFILRDGTIGIGYNVTRGSEEMGIEIAQRKRTMRPSEWKAWAEQYAVELSNQGIRDGNTWYIDQFINELTNDGYDPMASINQVFGLVDLGGLVTSGLKLTKAATRAATTTGRLAATVGIEEATEATVTRLSRQIEEDVLTDAGPKILNPHANTVGISESAWSRITRENRIVQEVKDLYSKGTFGRYGDEATIATKVDELAQAAADNFKARTGYRIVTNGIKAVDDNLGNFAVNLDVGTAKGVPFLPTAAGEIPTNIVKRAEDMGGRAVFVDPADPKAGVVIRFNENLKLTGLIDEINPNELMDLNTNFVSKIVNNEYTSSATARGVDALNVAAQRAEAGSSKLQSVFNVERRKIAKLNATERARLNVLTELRDGENAIRKTWYTQDEFIADYTKRFGEAPSAKTLEAYDAVVTISDAAWLLRDNHIFRKYVQADYRAVKVGEVYLPAKQIDTSAIPVDARVIDGKFGNAILKSDFRGDKTTFWKLDKPTDSGVEYVANTTSRGLEPFDVLGYNAGGVRINPNARWFVVTGSGNRLKTLLSAVTEKQAKQATEQLENIRKAGDNLTDDIIQKNNDWNPEIQTVKQFEDFAKENNWKFLDDVPIAPKQRDGTVLAKGEVSDGIENTLSLDDFVQADLRRNDKVLPSYGGGSTFNVDTVTAVQQQFGSVANEFAFHVATNKAIVGWVETAKKIPTISFPANISELDYRNLFLRAEIKGTDQLSNRMREVRSIEMRRMNMKGPAAEALERLGNSIADYVFDLGEGTFAKRTRTKNLLQSTALGNFIRDPSQALLKLGFTTAFGFFNIAQTFVQSIHAVSIMAISKQGMKGASMAFTLRSLYHTSPEAVEVGLRRAAKLYGYTYDQMKQIHEYVRTSGRDVIEGEAVELGTGAAYGISGWGGDSYKLSALDKTLYNTTKYGRAAMDKGLMFYRTGERMARMTGVYTAVAEYIAKNPNKSLLAEEARNWITRREQNLSLNMTTTSRGMAQSGVMRVPTQWLSYNLRAMEAIFVGRGFTVGERARLAASLTAFYGLSGFGMERGAEEVASMFGIGEDTALFTGLKWGVIDGIMDALLPEGEGEGRVGTGLAKRLSVVQGIMDTYRKIGGESTFLEVVGGPSYNIAKSFFGAGASLISNGLAGNPELMTEDVLQLIRQPSGIDNVSKAFGIFNNGLYVSKTGTAIPSQMTPSEGIMALFGVNSLKATEWYSAQSQAFADRGKLTDFRKEMNRRSEVAYRYIQNGETERGLRILGEIKSQITFSGFSIADRQSLFRSVLTRDESAFNRLFDDMLNADRAAAQRLLATQR